MRKLFSLMLVVLGAAALVSCSKDDDDVLRDGEGVITFVTKAKRIEVKKDSYYEPEEDLYLETFNAGDRITIDWGDGNEDEYVPVREEYKDEDGEIEVYYEIIPEHTYTDGKSSHTITVRGKIKWFSIDDCEVTSIDVTKCPALEGLDCEYNPLTSLNISKCTALKDLYCSGNQLTSLDISKNTALESLYCYHNQFSASAMNKIYNDLPQGRVDEYGERSRLICNKLGDYSIAENKGWDVQLIN